MYRVLNLFKLNVTRHNADISYIFETCAAAHYYFMVLHGSFLVGVYYSRTYVFIRAKYKES